MAQWDLHNEGQAERSALLAGIRSAFAPDQIARLARERAAHADQQASARLRRAAENALRIGDDAVDNVGSAIAAMDLPRVQLLDTAERLNNVRAHLARACEVRLRSRRVSLPRRRGSIGPHIQRARRAHCAGGRRRPTSRRTHSSSRAGPRSGGDKPPGEPDGDHHHGPHEDDDVVVLLAGGSR